MPAIFGWQSCSVYEAVTLRGLDICAQIWVRKTKEGIEPVTKVKQCCRVGHNVQHGMDTRENPYPYN